MFFCRVFFFECFFAVFFFIAVAYTLFREVEISTKASIFEDQNITGIHFGGGEMKIISYFISQIFSLIVVTL